MADNINSHAGDDSSIIDNTLVVQNRTSYLVIKKVFDYVASLIGITVLSPLLLIIAIVVKIQDGGSVFFKQKRVGRNGRTFVLYKFRSMNENAEAQKKHLLKKNEVDGAMFKMKDDPRVTKFGKFIRKHSLDELPQLFNVLKGDMSLIGPRPPLASEVKKYSDFDKQRLLVQPGLSGLWQVSGRNNLSFDDMVELDIQYIQTRSLRLDLKIIWKTVAEVINVKGNGAF